MNPAILVTGFGPFPGVDHNPTEALARAVHGAIVGGYRVEALVLPVSYARGPALAIARAAALDAAVVVGLGVAAGRPRVNVERRGVRRWLPDRPDVDGSADAALRGPEVVPATLDCEGLARALDADLSDDAGGYVCNAWLYQVASALPGRRVGFVHVPSAGLAPEALLRGLAALVG